MKPGEAKVGDRVVWSRPKRTGIICAIPGKFNDVGVNFGKSATYSLSTDGQLVWIAGVASVKENRVGILVPPYEGPLVFFRQVPPPKEGGLSLDR
jgi:hypothetical protein